MTRLKAFDSPTSRVDYPAIRTRRSSIGDRVRLLAFAGFLVILIPGLLTMDVKWSIALPLSILFSMLGQHFVAVALGPAEDIFGPITPISAYFLISMAGRALYIVLMPDVHRIGRVGYDDYLPEALWCSCLAYGSILLGYYSAWAKSGPAYLPQRELRWPASISPIRIVALATVSFAVLVYFLRHGVAVGGKFRGDPPNGFALLLTHALPLAWIAACICRSQARRASDKQKALLVVLLCLAYLLASIAISGSKQALFEPLLEGLIVFHYLRKRVNLLQLTVIGLPAVFLAFGAINFYRFVTVAQHGSPKSLADMVSLLSSATDSVGESSGGIRASAFEQMFDRQAGIDALAVVMKYTPNPRPFGYGASVIDAFISATIPRQLWPAKPLFDPSRDFEQNYLSMPSYYHGHTSCQLAADLYQNMGLPGVFLGMLIFGIFVKWLYLFCAPGRNRPAGVFFYAFLLPLVSYWTAITVGYFVIFLPRTLLLSVAAAMFLGVTYKKIGLSPKTAMNLRYVPRGGRASMAAP